MGLYGRICSTDEEVMVLSKETEIAAMIKKIIKARNRTIRMTASAMGIGYTTFCEQLNRGSLKAETLFRLAAYLDIDLNWMMAALNYYGQLIEVEREAVPRMTPSFRKNELVLVCARLDEHIRLTLGKTNEIRRELLNDFGKNWFYLLDVLVPEEFDIMIIRERNDVRFYVDTHENNRSTPMVMSFRRPRICALFSAEEALDNIIEKRKEEIL